ncbi:MAG: aminotransferase class I/II-fold pyridoxal phosphate-dependent enzyme [Chloroflexi bacterium]|nr:aminotransferase class I/II-fold pyridoxal phosphate-dependent enzyme [Chloroflexota bacterium]
MTFERMQIEDWFDEYQYKVDCNIGESGMKAHSLDELGIDLGGIPLRYGHHRGLPELREQIASGYPGLSVANIGVTIGAAEAIFAIAAALVGPGDNVVVEHPNFPSLYMAPASLERDVRLLRTTFDDQFRLDLDELQGQITPRTRLVMLCRPNNPTGAVITTAELEKVAEIIEASQAYLLMDETYYELSFDEPPVPAACLSKRFISVTTMSKAYGVPGIRIGWLAGDPAIVDMVRLVREQITICNPILSEMVALEVLKKKDAILPEARHLLTQNLARVNLWFQGRTDLSWVPPRAGVVGFPRLNGAASSEKLCRLLVDKYHTFTVPGYVFQMPEYFRIGFGVPLQELEEGLRRLDKALQEIEII